MSFKMIQENEITIEKVIKTFSILLLILFIINLIATPFWRITHDTVLIHYITMLIDRFEYIPYKEIYDTSMPGTFIFHLIIGKLFGYTESGLQLFNFFFTLCFWFFNWVYLNNISFFPRLIGSFYFLLIYQSYGLEMSLQRDVIACLFIIITAIIARTKNKSLPILICSGFSLGLAITLKPQLGVGLPIFLHMSLPKASIKDGYLNPKILKYLSIYIISVMGPIILSFIWLKEIGGWEAFWVMQKTYIPQYIQLNANHEFINSSLSRITTNIKNFLFMIPYWRMSLFILVFGTILNIKYDKKNKKFWHCNLALAILYAFTLIISGQYFPYHFMSFFLFSFFPITGFFSQNIPRKFRSLCLLTIIALFINNIGQFPIETISWLKGNAPLISNSGRVDRLTKVIKNNYRDGDSIQVFDWVEGATAHALMNLEIPHKGKFITDHIFKHHLHLSSKKTLINNFTNSMKSNPPSIIIESTQHNYPKGNFTSRFLPDDIRKFITTDYIAKHKDTDFTLYRHKGSYP
jgi:hypothetical protein